MALSFSEICWAIIAVTLLLALLFGWDITS
jgi:hypothetical protein